MLFPQGAALGADVAGWAGKSKVRNGYREGTEMGQMWQVGQEKSGRDRFIGVSDRALGQMWQEISVAGSALILPQPATNLKMIFDFVADGADRGR